MVRTASGAHAAQVRHSGESAVLVRARVRRPAQVGVSAAVCAAGCVHRRRAVHRAGRSRARRHIAHPLQLASSGALSARAAKVLHWANLLTELGFPVAFIHVLEPHPLFASITLFHYCIIWLKLVSWVDVNQVARRPHNRCTHPFSTFVSSGWPPQGLRPAPRAAAPG